MTRETAATEERTLDEVVRDAMAEWRIPGVTVAILHDGEIETRGYGVVSLETDYPTRPDTLFQVGSNSKVFTATLVMRLVEAGLLDLDAPVGRYLPDLPLAEPSAAATITLRQLLSHTSGLEGDRFEETGEGDDALGLKRAFYFAHEAIVYSAAAGHEQLPVQDAPHVARPYHIGHRAHPAGGIIASAGDLLAFLRFHMGDGMANGERVLSAESIRAMQEPQARISDEEAWGIGWAPRTVAGARIIRHGGGTNGHITQMLAVPAQNFGLVVLTNGNRGGHVVEAVEKWAFARYCGVRERDPEPISLSAAQLERLTGTYTQRLQEAAVTLEDGALTMTVTGNNPFSGEKIAYPPIPLVTISAWEVMATEGEWKGSWSRFIPGDDGRPRFLRLGGRLAPRHIDTVSP